MTGFYLIPHCSHFHTMNTLFTQFSGFFSFSQSSPDRNIFSHYGTQCIRAPFMDDDISFLASPGVHIFRFLGSDLLFFRSPQPFTGSGAHWLNFFTSHLLVADPIVLFFRPAQPFTGSGAHWLIFLPPPPVTCIGAPPKPFTGSGAYRLIFSITPTIYW